MNEEDFSRQKDDGKYDRECDSANTTKMGGKEVWTEHISHDTDADRAWML